MNYKLIDKLKLTQQTYDDVLAGYQANLKLYQEKLVKGNYAQELIGLKSQLSSDLLRLEGLINDMKDQLDILYGKGENNMEKSQKASDILNEQSILLERRQKVFQNVMDQFYYVVGEERSAYHHAKHLSYTYIIFGIIAMVMVYIIFHILMGGTINNVILLIVMIVGLFFVWEIYKNWLARFVPALPGLPGLASQIKTTIRMTT